MSSINWRRVLLGGLVVFAVGGLWNVFFMFSGLGDLVGYADPFGDEIPLPSGGVAGYIAWTLVAFAISTAPILLYAAFQPRYAAGMRTAVYAGLTWWFLNYCLGTPLPSLPAGVTTSLRGLLPGSFVLTQALSYLVPLGLIGVVLGARLYKEKEAPERTTVRAVQWGRMLLGGLLAGVVIIGSEAVLNTIASVDAPVEVSDNIVPWMLYGIVLGMASVWIYTAIRPRFGAGLRTAIYAGIATWILLVSYFPLAGWGQEGFPLGTLLIHRVWNLAELCLATSLGAWLYKKEDDVTSSSYASSASARVTPGL